MERLSPPVGSELCLGSPLCARGSPYWELEAQKGGLPSLEFQYACCLIFFTLEFVFSYYVIIG